MWCPIYWRRNLLHFPAHSTVQKRAVVGRQGTEQKTVEWKWVNAIANDSEKASWSETDDMGWDKLKDFSTLYKGAVKKCQVKAISRIYSNICSFLGLLMRISILTFGFTRVLHNFLLNLPLTGYRHNSIFIKLTFHNVERQESFMISFVE